MLLIQDGKGTKDRIVYISNDALHALLGYLKVRPANKVKKVFLVEKGPLTGQPISVRGIQKRMEYYAHKTKLRISCHHLQPHDGHTDVECRCRPFHHPGSPGAQLNQNDPTVLPSIKSESTKGLLQSHGGDHATNGWQPK
jgi:hypothetical protein